MQEEVTFTVRNSECRINVNKTATFLGTKWKAVKIIWVRGSFFYYPAILQRDHDYFSILLHLTWLSSCVSFSHISIN